MPVENPARQNAESQRPELSSPERAAYLRMMQEALAEFEAREGRKPATTEELDQIDEEVMSRIEAEREAVKAPPGPGTRMLIPG